MEEAMVADQTIVEIPVNLVTPNPYQPRQRFDEPQIEELANSIRSAGGLIQPVVVRPLDRAKGTFELIVGERRLRAYKFAGMEIIRAIIREDVTSEDAREMVLVENLQRVDLTPIEEARSVVGLLEQYDGSYAHVAERVGKSEGHVRIRASLLSLPLSVQAMLDEGKLNVTQAAAIVNLGLKDEKEVLKIAKKAYQLRFNANQIKGAVQGKQKGQDGSTERTGIVTIAAASKDLIRAHDSLEKYASDQLPKLTDAKKRMLLRDQIGAMKHLCEVILESLGVGE